MLLIDTNEKKRPQETEKEFSKPCIFCQGTRPCNGTVQENFCIKRSWSSLKAKPLLKLSHTWACGENVSCQICSATHPTLLHIKQKYKDQKNSSKGEAISYQRMCIKVCRTHCPKLRPGELIVCSAIVPMKQSADLLSIPVSRE